MEPFHHGKKERTSTRECGSAGVTVRHDVIVIPSSERHIHTRACEGRLHNGRMKTVISTLDDNVSRRAATSVFSNCDQSCDEHDKQATENPCVGNQTPFLVTFFDAFTISNYHISEFEFTTSNYLQSVQQCRGANPLERRQQQCY